MARVAERDTTEVKPSTRRERGVLAQRAYRKRHASKFQSLKEENERLRHAIQRIGFVASGEGRFNSELDTAIQSAKDVAVAGEEGDEAAKAPSRRGSGGSPGQEERSKMQITSETCSSAANGLRNVNVPTSSGIFIDASMQMRSFAMPSNCPSYLANDGQETLATGMYKAVLSIAIRRWHDHFQRQGELHNPAEQSLPIDYAAPALKIPMNPLSSNPLKSAFPLLPPHDTDDPVSPCIFSRPPSEKLTDSTPTCAHELARQRQQEGWWRAADGLETYLRQQVLPTKGLAIFEEVMGGGGTTKQIGDVQDMLEGLARNYKCFGDGPRWNAVYVTVAMDMFRKDIMGGL